MNRLIYVAIGALVVATTGCAAADAGGKAGGNDGPIVLRIGTDDFQARPASDQIEEFVRAVADLSDGSIQIEPVWHAAGDGPDWDQRVGRMVVSGELDLGNIPARTWDSEGVATLRALNNPFMVTNDDMVAAIVSSPIADDLLEGLEVVGLTGLALLPEGLRHPFAFDHALLGPDDYDGATLRAPTSAMTSAMFASLGAEAVDADVAGASGLAGWESGFVLGPKPTIATGNVTFFPKVNSLVVNTDRFDALDETQRDVLREAAARTRQWAIEHTTPDAELAAGWCTSGGSVVLADDAQLSALKLAVAPVVAELEADASTASIIEAIRQLTANVATPAAPEPCSSPSSELVGDGNEVAVLNGVYRVSHTEDELLEAGAPRAGAINHAATWTLTFADGVLGISDDNPTAGSTCEGGSYQVDGDRVALVLGPNCGSESGQTLLDATWALDATGLTLSEIQPADPILRAVFGRTVWSKIGEAGTSPGPADATPEALSALNGVYRFEVTSDALERAGLDETEVFDNAGIWTFTFYDGDGEFAFAAPTEVEDPYDYFTFAVDGDEVVFTYDGGEQETYQWSILDDKLMLTLIDGPPSYAALSEVLVAEPWQRIGDSGPIDVKDTAD
jgi:TRAP-type C4-dicarboxylate transport system substrate-binding protein